MPVDPIIAQTDTRPRKGAWSPGNYLCKCIQCGENFIGEKRAFLCAPCAYGDSKESPVERHVHTHPPLEPWQHELLDCLIEECAEVIQRATKMQRFGIEEVQPGQPEDNRMRLSGELGDLLCLISLVEHHGLALPQMIDHFADLKPQALRKYMRHLPPGGI